MTTASRSALEALVQDAPQDACEPTRQLIARAGLLWARDAARRDAHLEECVHCRANGVRSSCPPTCRSRSRFSHALR
jgi:hypothetical protein